MWPAFEVVKFLDVAEDQSSTTKEGQAIRTVFLATAIELAFEHILWAVLRDKSKSHHLPDAFLEAVDQLDRRKEIFKNLTGESADRILADLGHGRFAADWVHLRRKRNRVVHGNFYFSVCEAPDSDDKLLSRITPTFIPAFADLENHVREQLAPLPTAPGAPSSDIVPEPIGLDITGGPPNVPGT